MRRLIRAWNKRASLEFIWTWMACLLFAVSATSYAPKTSRGVQCPTAEVQEITVVRTVKTCCGDEVQVVEKRKPQPGEEGFKQCQCAEKKTSHADEGKRTGELPVFDLPEALIPPSLRLLPDHNQVEPMRDTLPTEPSSSPPTPPPNFI